MNKLSEVLNSSQYQAIFETLLNIVLERLRLSQNRELRQQTLVILMERVGLTKGNGCVEMKIVIPEGEFVSVFQ